MTPSPIPVFVSSTFLDLKKHRKAVCDALRQGGYIDVAMEHLGARDDRPIDTCLRMVTDYSKYFVGIYAHRYGYVPDGHSISITEAEYNAATNAGLKRLAYFIDDKYPWPPTYIDKVGKPARSLTRFKRHLQNAHHRQEFTTADNLAKKVMADLGLLVREDELGKLKRVNQKSRGSSRPKLWTKGRQSRYEERRFTELVHSIVPSADPDQEYDIHIYLYRHRDRELSSPVGLDDVVCAEFFFGKYWGNKVFECKNTGGVIGINVSAYGTFLCLCRVTFTDGSEIILDRYIDFESYA